ncbi:hypothetical protein [Desulfovibrio litoralis]|nr:hypothetical protein [Desulfovibrio litoralis]
MPKKLLSKSLRLVSIIAFMLLLSACFVESDQHVLQEQTVIFDTADEKIPYISGVYFSEAQVKKAPRETVVLERKEGSHNAFFLSLKIGETEQQRSLTLIKPLKQENTFLLEVVDCEKSTLVPVMLTKKGLTLYPVQEPDQFPYKVAWVMPVFTKLLTLHKISHSENGLKLKKGDMSQEAYQEAVVNLFNDMFSLAAFGEGIALTKE